MNTMEEIKLRLKIRGEYTEQEFQDYVYFTLVGGSLDNHNAFINEESEAEIMDIEFD